MLDVVVLTVQRGLMNTIENDNVVCFDVDDTLVMWSIPTERAHEAITFDNFGYATELLPHLKHVELLKQFKVRGHYVVVWSQGGYQWAREVVKTLGIEKYVDSVMTKPKWIVDDLPPGAWLTRSYMDLDGKRISYGETKAIFGEDDE
jgi:phosphoserine phosphatase